MSILLTEKSPNGKLTVKEGELDVGAKIKECCSDTKNLSVAAHQPTKAVAASKEVRVRNSDNKAAYVYVYEGSSEFFFRCNFPGVFDRIRGSSLSINGNNVAVLFYGSCYTNGDSETDRFFVWNRRNKVKRYSKENTCYDKICLASDTWLVAAWTCLSKDKSTMEHRFTLLDIKNEIETHFLLVPEGCTGPGSYFCKIDSEESASSSTPDVTIAALIEMCPGDSNHPVGTPGIPTFEISVPLSKLVKFAESGRKDIAWDEWKTHTKTKSLMIPGDKDYVSGYGYVLQPLRSAKH